MATPEHRSAGMGITRLKSAFAITLVITAAWGLGVTLGRSAVAPGRDALIDGTGIPALGFMSGADVWFCGPLRFGHALPDAMAARGLPPPASTTNCPTCAKRGRRRRSDLCGY